MRLISSARGGRERPIHRPPVAARALLPNAAEYLPEMVGVRKAALTRDARKRQARRHEQARSALDLQLGDEAGGREPRTFSEVMAERRAAHASFSRERAHVEASTGASDDT